MASRNETITKTASANLSALASSASNGTLLAANPGRIGLIVQNTDANALYLKFGATAVIASSWTVKVPANDGYWVMPEPIWTGQIDAIWAGDGSGSAFTTELVD